LLYCIAPYSYVGTVVIKQALNLLLITASTLRYFFLAIPCPSISAGRCADYGKASSRLLPGEVCATLRLDIAGTETVSGQMQNDRLVHDRIASRTHTHPISFHGME
jgi:hypothetical protein